MDSAVTVNRVVSLLVLALVTLCAVSGHAQGPGAAQEGAVLPSQHQSQAGRVAVSPGGTPGLEDIEERRGPFTLGGQTFNVVLHYKGSTRKDGVDSRALVSLEIRDAGGKVQYRESVPYAVERGALSEACSVDVKPLNGSNGAGFLIESACLPSAPLSGGPWQIVGVVGGKLVPIGKPLATQGELGDFVPGAVTRIGNVTQILPDMLKIRAWTGYFFVSIPVRIDWREGKLAPGQRCMYQTGRGFVEGGCEMPVEGVRLAPREQELTFVRMFRESEENSGPAAHIVVKADSKLEVVAGKVLVAWQEGPEALWLSVGEDVWVKVRIDGKEGWIHTPEDLNAIGLFASG